MEESEPLKVHPSLLEPLLEVHRAEASLREAQQKVNKAQRVLKRKVEAVVGRVGLELGGYVCPTSPTGRCIYLEEVDEHTDKICLCCEEPEDRP